ncbi:hypothetical protein Tco_0688492, partial [Tanacetum coccineum]
MINSRSSVSTTTNTPYAQLFISQRYAFNMIDGYEVKVVNRNLHPVTISSGLVPNPPSTPFVPPSRADWDLLFQPMFDESLNPPPYIDLQAPKVIAPIPEVVAPEHAVSTGSPSSTRVDHDAPSP